MSVNLAEYNIFEWRNLSLVLYPQTKTGPDEVLADEVQEDACRQITGNTQDRFVQAPAFLHSLDTVRDKQAVYSLDQYSDARAIMLSQHQVSDPLLFRLLHISSPLGFR